MRALVLSLALLWWGCSLYSPFGIDNPDSCRPHPELCAAGTVCDLELGRCLPQPTGGPAGLTDLSVLGGTLSPAFASGTTVYTATVLPLTLAVQFTPTAAAGATIEVGGVPVASGSTSAPITVGNGVLMLTITVHVPGQPDQLYGIAVTRAPPDYLKASNTGMQDALGTAVSLSGDTLAVGAPGEASSARGVNGNQADNSSFESGAVYVFVRTSSGWAQQAYLKASNSAAGSRFGYSVALSGDSLAIGAYRENSGAQGINGNQSDTGAAKSGAVYVFQRSGTDWTQQAYLKASNTEASDNFGYSVALAGDTLAVGAILEDSGSSTNQSDNSTPSAGAVYVFQRSGGAWTQQAYLKASNPGSGDNFGYGVALASDTLAVGAIDEASNGDQADNSIPLSGAVYVFQRSGTTWSQQAYLKASSPGANSEFGYSVALAGDTLAVGAHRESSAATGINGNQANKSAVDAGAVYVFQRSGTTWAQQAYIKASNTDAGDLFGSSLALADDTLVVGAPMEGSAATGINGNQADNGAAGAGAVYLFARSGTTWAQQAYIKASRTNVANHFGTSVALSQGTLVSGTPDEQSSATGVNGNQADSSLSDAGAVYVFR